MHRWLALSLAANLVLAGWLFFSRRATPPVVTFTNIPVARAHEPAVSLKPIAVAPRSVGDWRSWLDQLRLAGVPDKVLAGLATADFEGRWEDQQRELQRKYDNGDLDDDDLAK